MPIAFAPESGKAAGHRSALSRKLSPVADVAEMQAMLRADVLNPDTTPAERAQLMRAWVDGEKLKRVIRGQPANTSQSIKGEAKPKQRKRITGPIEPE